MPLISFLALTLVGTGFAQPDDRCLAFLLKADVTIVCQNRTTQITHRRDLEDFAISEEHSSLAFVTSRVLSRDANSATVAYTTTVIDLKAGTSRNVKGASGVANTCGGILPDGVAAEGTTRDVLTGEQVTFPPYTRFRCSRDRSVIAGVTEDRRRGQRSGFYEGVPPSRQLAGSEELGFYRFDVSPDGSKIAYFSDLRPLCLYSRPETTQCVQHGTLVDPAVNDSAEVLVATGTGIGCVYRTSFDFEPAPPGSYGDDECLGIGYWKPGMESIDVIVPLGRKPQWISPRTADLLRAWSAQTDPAARKK